MTELDTQTLRRALSTREDAADTRVDIALIVRRGRSLRRRRRFAAVAGGACAAAAIFGALTAITHLTRPATAPAHAPAISGRTTPGPSPHRPVPSASPPAAVTTPVPKAKPATPGPPPGPPPRPSRRRFPRGVRPDGDCRPSPRPILPSLRARPPCRPLAPLSVPPRRRRAADTAEPLIPVSAMWAVGAGLATFVDCAGDFGQRGEPRYYPY